MADRPALYEISQIFVETTEGTAGPATIRASASSFDVDPTVAFNRTIGMGYNLPVLVDPIKQWTVVKASGGLTYTELPYILASAIKFLAPTAGGLVSQVWSVKPSSTAVEVTKTYTIEQGQAARAQRASGCRFAGLTIDLDRNAGCKFTATGIGQLFSDPFTLTTLTPVAEINSIGLGAASAGTVTLTFNNGVTAVTTASMAYNLTTAAVQTAINTALGTGNCTVSGAGPWPAALTFTFTGAYANAPILVTGTATGLTGGAITITRSTPGVRTEVPLVPVLGSQLDFFIDPTSGAFGTTKLLRAEKLSLAFATRFAPMFAANTANASYATTVPAPGAVTGSLGVQADAAGMAMLTNMTAGSTWYLRGMATGALIESAHNFKFIEDLCVKVSGDPNFSASQGMKMITWPFEVVHDSTYGGGFTISVENLSTVLGT